MRVSKTGVGLVITYLSVMCVCIIWAQFISDPKGKFVILQIPVVLQHGFLLVFDATHLLSGASWLLIYLVLGLPMILMLALVGWLIEYCVSKIKHSAKTLNKSNQQGPTAGTR
jgi:hypothetical protein